jgi:16S rRNA (uracil1498-N3)-methyltransferase
MQSPRLYCAAPLSGANSAHEFELPPDAARHVALALRMRVGDAVTLFNGEGGEYAATITRIDKRGVVVRIDSFDPIERETSFPVTLVQSIIASDMMDLVVRKAVELGAAEIAPIISERTQRLPSARTHKRVERWRQIAVSACEQCGRNRVPAIGDVISLADWLDRDGVRSGVMMLVPDESVAYGDIVRERAPRSVIVGPEGGFTAHEVEQARRRGVTLARFGTTILRAETAALAALAVIAACAKTPAAT